MKVIHTSDWHLGKNLEGHSRLDEQEEFLEFFIQACQEMEPDLIIIAGDIYDTPNPPARAEKLFYDSLKRLSRDGDCLILVIAGNHDNPERLVAAWPIAMEHGVLMLGSLKSQAEIGSYGQHQVLDSGEGYVEVEIRGEKAVILAVAYPSEKRINEVFYKEDQTEEERLKSYGEKIQQIFSQLEEKFREDTINITTSHLFAFGAEEAGSERSISLGGSFIVNQNFLPQSAQYTALGHIHKPQVLPGSKGKMIYSGSPIHYSKSEPKTEKKFFEIQLKVGQEALIREHIIPIFKPIEVWRAKSIGQALDLCQEKKGEKSWVYLEIETDRYLRDEEVKEMKSLKEDILEIKPLIEAIEKGIDYERMNEMSFIDQFKEFYQAQKKIEASQDLLTALISILEEEDQDETN